MSILVGNRLNGIIPRGPLAQAHAANQGEGGAFRQVENLSAETPDLQHGRARDLAGVMPAASWQVLASAAEAAANPAASQIKGSYDYLARGKSQHVSSSLDAKL